MVEEWVGTAGIEVSDSDGGGGRGMGAYGKFVVCLDEAVVGSCGLRTRSEGGVSGSGRDDGGCSADPIRRDETGAGMFCGR